MSRIQFLNRRRHILLTKPGVLTPGEQDWLEEIELELEYLDSEIHTTG